MIVKSMSYGRCLEFGGTDSIAGRVRVDATEVIQSLATKRAKPCSNVNREIPVREMFMSKRSLGTWMALVVGLAIALSVTPAFADSQVRIVRLSTIDGSVQADRNAGQGFENAFMNMPV